MKNKIKEKVLKEVVKGDFPEKIVLEGNDYDRVMFVLKKTADLTLAEVGKVIDEIELKNGNWCDAWFELKQKLFGK